MATHDDIVTISLTIFYFRGVPDAWYKRHVLIYFTSPDLPDFYETVHAQRDDDSSPWAVDQIHTKMHWAESRTYLGHVNAGAVQVYRGQEMQPVDIVSATPVTDRESEWNCQHFLLEGLRGIVSAGLQTDEWYDWVEGELMDNLLEGSVG